MDKEVKKMALKDYDFNEVFAGFRNVISDFSSLMTGRESLVNGENFIILNGYLEKEKGYRYFKGIASPLTGSILAIPVYLRYSGDKIQLAITSTNLYKLNTGWAQITNALGGNDDDIVSYINMADLFIFVHKSVGIVRKYDGTNYGNLFGSPDDTNRKARFIVEHEGSLVLVRTIEEGTEYYQRLWWSYPYSPTNFDPYDKLDIPKQVVIENAMSLENYIVVYCQKGIFRIPNLYSTDTITDEIGIIAPKSLASDGTAHYFLSQEGLMKLQGGRLVALSSQRFNKILIDNIDSINYPKAIGVFVPYLHQYRLIFPLKGTNYNNTMIIYDTLKDELIGIENFPFGITALGVSRPEIAERTDAGDIFLLGKADRIILEKYTNYARPESTYTTTFEFKKEIFGNINILKRILAITVNISKKSTTDLKLEFILKNEKGASKSYYMTISGPPEQGIIKTIYTHFIGREFSVIIRDVNNSQGFSIKDFIVHGNYLTRL